MQDKAKRAIELSLKTDSPHSGVTEYFGSLRRWNRVHALLTPAESGILPASGSTMIGFEKMMVDVETQKAEIEETIQVLDVREAIKRQKGIMREFMQLLNLIKVLAKLRKVLNLVSPYKLSKRIQILHHMNWCVLMRVYLRTGIRIHGI